MSGVGGVVRFSTQGGPGSVYADLDGIDAAAERFREAADVTRVLVFHAEHAASLVDRAASGPGAAARLREALREGARRLQGLTDALARNREDLRRAAEAYRRAEQGAAGVMDAEDPRAAVLGAALEARAADGLSVEEAEFLVRAGTEVVGEALLAQLLGLPVGTTVDGGIAAIGGFGGPVRDWVAGQCAVGELGGELEWAADRLGDIDPSLRLTPAAAWRLIAEVYPLLDPTNADPLEVAGEPVDHLEAPRRLTGHLSEVAHLIPRHSDGEGAVTVTRIRGADGADVWLVGLPGTQEGLLPQHRSDNWADGGGNLDALGNDSRRTAAGIAQALAAAGVPTGADLLLAGYSQGGVHAVNLADDPGFSQAYSVRGVMTVGAPNGNQSAPAGVPILEFATDRDLYTAADGGPNPLGLQRATVTFHPEGPDEAPALLAPGTSSEAGWQDGLERLGPDRLDPHDLPGLASRLGQDAEAVATDLDRAHALGDYTRMIEDFEAADPAARAEVAGVHAALAGLATGAVLSSRTVRLQRSVEGADARRRAGVVSQAPEEIARTPRSR